MTPAEKTASEKVWRRPGKDRAEKKPAVWECNLQATRQGLRLSMKDVADAIGMSIAGYYAVEHGNEVMLTTAVTLAEYFGCSIESLWPKRLI